MGSSTAGTSEIGEGGASGRSGTSASGSSGGAETSSSGFVSQSCSIGACSIGVAATGAAAVRREAPPARAGARTWRSDPGPRSEHRRAELPARPRRRHSAADTPSASASWAFLPNESSFFQTDAEPASLSGAPTSGLRRNEISFFQIGVFFSSLISGSRNPQAGGGTRPPFSLRSRRVRAGPRAGRGGSSSQALPRA